MKRPIFVAIQRACTRETGYKAHSTKSNGKQDDLYASLAHVRTVSAAQLTKKM